MNNKQTIYITSQGAIKLQQRINALNERIVEIQQEKAVAYWGSGDGWHDNPGFNQLEQLEHRTINTMVELKNRLENATLWNAAKNRPQVAQIGSSVTFIQKNLQSGRTNTLTVTLVGFHESDLKKMWISYDSPIGEALYNAGLGQVVQYTIPSGSFEGQITHIETDINFVISD